MMSTCFSKHVEAWNKYIKKECVMLVINQNYVKVHGQQNIKMLPKYFKDSTFSSCFWSIIIFTGNSRLEILIKAIEYPVTFGVN
jgi:hypothetical protein